MERNNPTCKQQALAELKQRGIHIAILFGAALLFTGVAFLVLRDPKPDDTVQQEPEGYLNGYAYVDLGLSVKWAETNVGAVADSLMGDYFAWGEIETKEYYAEDNYTCLGSKVRSIERKRKHDAATNIFGRGWRMPTKDEVVELVEECSWEYVATEGRNGYRVTGPNGNSIFLPADTTNGAMQLWSAYAVEGDPTTAYAISVVDTIRNVAALPAYKGLQVRAVTR